MTEVSFKSVQEAAAELGVTPSTLKTWAREFAKYLSSAPPTEPDGSRQFTSEDVTVLHRIKQHFAAGLTVEETMDELENAGHGDQAQYALAPREAPGAGWAVLTDTLRAMIENQQTIQNSLQVNRNLLGVIIQDNFNLKEENAKLRDRMQKIEQEASEAKQRESEYRLYLEQRFNRVDQGLRSVAQEARKGFFARLFGG
jgi:DNA-binding transcriptional MerR regulator